MTRSRVLNRAAVLVAVVGLVGLMGFGVPSAGAATQTATYTLIFDATWSAATHPVDFPPNPHFSGLIGGTHNNAVSLWSPGGLSSPGMEAMAEIGSKSPLDSEVQTAINAGDAGAIISGGGIPVSPGNVSVSFTVTQQHSQISVVSMIAPSPDWFVGVHDLELFVNGDWVNNLVVSLFPYDAGTDGGGEYTAPNWDTNPQDPIVQINDGVVGNGVPLGTFTLVRTDAVPATSPAMRGIGAMVVALLGMGFLAMRVRRA